MVSRNMLDFSKMQKFVGPSQLDTYVRSCGRWIILFGIGLASVFAILPTTRQHQSQGRE
jgi:hypothetical protein